MSDTQAQREAYDLYNVACRDNFKRAIGRRWSNLRWWKLVWRDTRDRVCSGGCAR